MRIGQVTYSYKPVRGGADVYALALHNLLTEAGHESLVWQGDDPEAEGDEVRFIPETSLSRMGRGRFWTLPFGLRKAARELASCDVLIAHYANYHRPVAWHPRTILLSHGVWWDDRPSAMRSRIKKTISRQAFERAAAVVSNDTFFLREMGLDVEPGLEPHAEVEPGRHYVPNGVDLELFSPLAVPAIGAPPIILVPRNIFRNRGVHLAIQAMPLILADVDARMRIVGGVGQPDYTDECGRLVSELRLTEHVEFAGAAPWDGMPDEYRSACIALVPTICGEGTSLSALESMACGTPCVATAVAGLRDLPALLCEPTPEAIATACLQAIEGRATLADEQLEAVRNGFGIDAWSEAWLRVVERTGSLV